MWSHAACAARTFFGGAHMSLFSSAMLVSSTSRILFLSRFVMRTSLAILPVLIIAGAIALHYGFTRGQIGEWEAGRLPYPGPSVAASDSFQLHTGGRFELKILSACTDAERNGLLSDTTPTALHVVLKGADGLLIDKSVTSVRVGAWSAAGRTFSPGANEVWRLSAGAYNIRIEGRGSVPPVFQSRGAVIYLGRMEPVGRDLGVELSRIAGYGLLVFAGVVSGAVAAAERQRRSVRHS